MPADLQVFDDAAAACRAAAELVRAARTVAFSGGATASAFFYVLAAAGLDWSQKELFWVDERCVPPDDKDSNYGLARRLLLSKVRVPEDRVWRLRGEDEPQKAAADYEEVLRRRAPDGLDLAILGVGPDGHTASLFPGVPALEEKTRWTAVTRSPKGQARLTLTLPYLAKAKLCAALLLGAGKKDVLHKALHEPQAGLPIQRAFAAARVLVLADKAAAG